jgi:hypothetical protein
MYHQPYDHLQPIAGQLQYAIVSENRVDWSYFDLLSLVVRVQNRAIRCDWGFTCQHLLLTERPEVFTFKCQTITTYLGLTQLLIMRSIQFSCHSGPHGTCIL